MTLLSNPSSHQLGPWWDSPCFEDEVLMAYLAIIMLKGTSESIAPVLFNSSLRWSDPCYRPISLLPIVSKVQERHVCNLVWEHLEDTGHIPDNQWGFTQGISTVTALLSTFNSVYHYNIMEQGYGVILLFLDLSKAFVPYVPLLHQLKGTGLNPYIVQWIAFCFPNRKQYVVAQGESSTDTSVASGVP